MSGSTQPHFTLDVPRRSTPRLVVAPTDDGVSADREGPSMDATHAAPGAAGTRTDHGPRVTSVAGNATRRDQIGRIYTRVVTIGLVGAASYLAWAYEIRPRLQSASQPSPVVATAPAQAPAPVVSTPASREPSLAEMMGRAAPQKTPETASPKAVAVVPQTSAPAPQAAAPVAASTSSGPAPAKPSTEDASPSRDATETSTARLTAKLDDLTTRLVRAEALLTAMRDDQRSERAATNQSIQALSERVGAESAHLQDLAGRMEKAPITPPVANHAVTRQEQSLPRETAPPAKRPAPEAPLPLPQYHVVAGSPDMVILHGAGPDDASFALDGLVPGWGRIRSITQEGDRWVLRTDKGVIR